MAIACTMCSAQTVSSLKYWLDSDFNGAKTVDVTDTRPQFDVDIAGQSEGVHFFYVMPQDSEGNWGKLHRYLYLIPDTKSATEGTAIKRIEYWIDNDFASRITESTTNTTIALSIDISTYAHGVHTLNYRVINDKGQYSPVKIMSFFVNPDEAIGTSVASAEYWMDDNYSTRSTATASGNEVLLQNLDISNLSTGVHFLYVQPKDNNGKPGKLHRHMFYIPKAADDSRIATMGGMEYWIDGDIENKTVVNSDATTTPLSIDIATLKYGVHTLSYRAFNSLGEWGPVSNKLFYVNDKDFSTQQPLTGYRYFFNDMTGESDIADLTQFDKSISLPIPNTKLVPIDLDSCKFVFNSPADGKATMTRNVKYDFTIQFKNKAGEWNAPTAHIFAVPENVEADITEVALEGSETFTKVQGGNIKVLKFVVTNEDSYYFWSPQKGSMGLYNADGTQRASLSPSSMLSGFKDYLEPGTYYGVVHNTIKDGDNMEDDYTVRFNTSSIKIGGLKTTVTDNVLYLSCATDGVTIYYTTDGTKPTKESALYTSEGIKLTENIRIQAFAMKDGMLSSDYLTYDVDGFKVADPEIKIENLKFVVTTATEGATIYYTLDGTSPLISGIKYTEPIPLKNDITIIAAAKKDNYNTSDEVSKTFYLSEWTCKEPLFSREDNLLEITSETENAVIYYTLDGNDPSIKSTKYPEGGITLTQNCTVKAIATMQGTMYPSEIKSFTASYFKVATPTIKVENTKIVIDCATEGASIYYMLEYGTPTLDNAIRYTEPIELSGDTYVTAFAMKDNFVSSSSTSSVWLTVSSYTCKKPVISVKDNVVTITTNTEGGKIYYTLDGSDPTAESTEYTAPITLADNRTVKAIVSKDGELFDSEIVTWDVSYFKVATPTMKVVNTKIVIECETEGADIFYLFGTDEPTIENTKKYTGPIPLTEDTYVRAFAVKDNYNPSAPSGYYDYFFSIYDYKCKNPVFKRENMNKLTVSSETNGAVIYYTMDGSDPTDQSAVYTEEGIILSENCVVKAKAVKPGEMFDSEISSIEINNFYVEEPTAEIVDKKLVLSCATEGAAIYYTVDGSGIEDGKGFKYTGPITWNEDFVLYAMAKKENFNNSGTYYKLFNVSDYKCTTPQITRSGNIMNISTSTEGAVIYYTTDGSTPTTSSEVFPDGGITLTENCTIKAIAIKDGKLFDSEVYTYEVTHFEVVAPVISLDGTKVVLTCATEGAKIFYTTDGSNPSQSHGKLYSNPISWSADLLIYAIAVKDNYRNSNVSSRSFDYNEYQCASPTFRREENVLYLGSETENAVIYYTMDRTEPTTSSSRYSDESGIPLIQNCVVKAIATKEGELFRSDVNTLDITHFQCAGPTANVVNKKIVLSCSTEDAVIYYSTDGSIPTEATGKRYSAPLPLSSDVYIYALAVKPNFYNSELQYFVYYYSDYKCVSPTFSREGNMLYVTSETADAKIYYTTDGTTPTSSSTEYTGGISLTQNCQVQAIAIKSEDMYDSEVSSIDITHFTVAEPTFTVVNKKIVLSCATEGASIYYTTDGASIEDGAGLLYTEPISWSEDFTLQAYAKKTNFNTSGAIAYVFNVSSYRCAKPLFTKDGDKLLLACPTADAKIYYTTDGSTPTSSSTQYTEDGISVEFNCTVKAVAVKEGELFDSEVATYDITGFAVAEPTFTVVNKKIVLSCATEGASIYYTTDGGSVVEGDGILYTEPISWSEDFILQAYAKKTNFNTSDIVAYALNVSSYRCVKPVFSKDGDKLMLTSPTADAKIYYTTDGSTPTSSSTQYTEDGITVEFNCTVKAVAVKEGELFDSEVATYDITGFAVAEPTMKVDNLTVVLECATEGAKIYYTTNTEVDVMTAGTLYTSPIPFTADMTISFYAKKDNFDNSSVQTTYLYASEYTCKKPTFQVQRASAANGYKDKVTITSADGGTIYYTLDGNDPSYDSPSRQTGSEFELTKNCKILAVAAKSGMFQSDTVAYNIDFIKAKTPVMAFDETKKQLTITCATTDAKIFYTIGGETPSATSIEYTGALTLTDNKEIKAIAISSDCLNSSVASYKPTYFSCAPVTVEYDGRSVKFACTTDGAAIYYTTNGYTPSDDSDKYDGNAVILDGISTVKAVAIKSNLNNATVTFEPTAYYNGGKTYVTKAGDLEKAYKWCGKEKIIDVNIEGSLSATDITTIKGMKAAKYLDLSNVTMTEKTLPEKAFEGLDLISFSSPADITEAGDSLLKDARSIGAVVWNADIAVPENIMGDITPVNALLYVQNDDHKNSKFRNVVVNGVASEITLSDADALSNFYCPVEFTADKISYRHTYTLPTEKNVLTGWEALSLPFTPTSISHSKNGECVPFEAYKKNPESGKPFWLCELTSTGFAKAEQIVANKGYIVCMPNNEDYGDDYILGGNGDITYMAENATIPVTASSFDDPDMMNDYIFRPNYAHLAQNDTVMVINKTDYGTNRPGSVFVPNLRPAYPFEAYVTKSPTSSSKAAPLRVDGGEVGIMETLYGFGDINQTVYSEDGALYIFSKTAGKVKIYKSTGILYKTVDVRSGWTRVDDLAKDVYVVKGRKVIVR